MSELSMFLKENVEVGKTKKVVVSTRFKDEKNKPVKWEVKSISAKENEALRKACMDRVKAGKQVSNNFDANRYQMLLCAKCTVYPDLNDSKLQDSWGVMGAENLLGEMLLTGELDEYTKVVFELNGFNITDDDLVEEAKN